MLKGKVPYLILRLSAVIDRKSMDEIRSGPYFPSSTEDSVWGSGLKGAQGESRGPRGNHGVPCA